MPRATRWGPSSTRSTVMSQVMCRPRVLGALGDDRSVEGAWHSGRAVGRRRPPVREPRSTRRDRTESCPGRHSYVTESHPVRSGRDVSCGTVQAARSSAGGRQRHRRRGHGHCRRVRARGHPPPEAEPGPTARDEHRRRHRRHAQPAASHHPRGRSGRAPAGTGRSHCRGASLTRPRSGRVPGRRRRCVRPAPPMEVGLHSAGHGHAARWAADPRSQRERDTR